MRYNVDSLGLSKLKWRKHSTPYCDMVLLKYGKPAGSKRDSGAIGIMRLHILGTGIRQKTAIFWSRMMNMSMSMKN